MEQMKKCDIGWFQNDIYTLQTDFFSLLLYNNSFQIQLSRVQSLQKLSSQFYFNVTLEHHSFSSLEVFFSSSQIHIHITIYVKVKNLQKNFNKLISQKQAQKYYNCCSCESEKKHESIQFGKETYTIWKFQHDISFIIKTHVLTRTNPKGSAYSNFCIRQIHRYDE